MATSNFSGSYGSLLKLEGLFGVVSQDKATNQSKIRVWANLSTGNGASLTGISAPLTITVNKGGAVKTLTININSNSKVLLWFAEYNIQHDVNGNAHVDLSLKLDVNNGGYGSATVNFGGDLPQIKRASTVTASSTEIGKSGTITITPSDSSYTHTVRYEYNGKTGIIATGVGTTTNWTVPLDFANDLPNSTSGIVNIYADTYTGDTQLGTNSTSMNISVPSSMVPTLSDFTLTETNNTVKNLITDSGYYVQIYSNIQVTKGTAKGSYSSTIKSFKAELVGKNTTINNSGDSFGTMNFNGSVVVRATVTDSRGRESVPVDKTITILEYKPPMLSFDVKRTGSTSSTLTVNRNTQISPLTVNGAQKNIMTLTFKVSPYGAETYTTDNGQASGQWSAISSLVNSQANLSGTYAPNTSWDIIGILTDSLGGSVTFKPPAVIAEKVVFSYDQNGMGIGKPREKGTLDVAKGGIYHDGKLIQLKQLTDDTGAWLSDVKVVTPNSSPTFGTVTSTTTTATDTVTAPKVLITDTKKTTVSFPFGLVAAVIRKGNMVTMAISRVSANVGSYEYGSMNETISTGYRPVIETPFLITANSGSNVQGTAVIHLLNTGEIKLTNGLTGTKVWNGSISYLTNDTYPS
ncbi:TPA: hypothetical protein U3L57_000071 [Streptococcus agalactiae]|nr:hypothetical protein [Streptococcus agalactiae]